MPLGPGLDIPSLLHHVIVRGVERRRIVVVDGQVRTVDRSRLVTRFGTLGSHTTRGVLDTLAELFSP